MRTITILGQEMVLVPMDQVTEALGALTRMAADSGGAFTCMEAEAVAALFVAAGVDPGQFIEFHALGDEPDDLHWVGDQRENGDNT